MAVVNHWAPKGTGDKLALYQTTVGIRWLQVSATGDIEIYDTDGTTLLQTLTSGGGAAASKHTAYWPSAGPPVAATDTNKFYLPEISNVIGYAASVTNVLDGTVSLEIKRDGGAFTTPLTFNIPTATSFIYVPVPGGSEQSVSQGGYVSATVTAIAATNATDLAVQVFLQET